MGSSACESDASDHVLDSSRPNHAYLFGTRADELNWLSGSDLEVCENVRMRRMEPHRTDRL